MKRREKTRENTITSQSLMASAVSDGPVSVSNSVLYITYIFILYNIYTVLKPRCCHGMQVQHVELRVFRHLLLPVKALKGMPS